jgi:hypothetical protein
MADKNVRDMTNEELLAEYVKWRDKVASATGWGAALAAADEFRTDALREIKRRGIKLCDQS